MIERFNREKLFQTNRFGRFPSYLIALALTTSATVVCQVIRPYVSPTNMVMVYLLAVILAALWLGLKPAILTASLGVLAFDYFFVPPRFSFSVADKEYLITFFALFLVGVVVSTLVTKVRDRAEALREREAETASLYRLSRDLAIAADRQAVINAILKNVESSLDASAVLFLVEGNELTLATGNGLPADAETEKIANWVHQSLRPAGAGTSMFPESKLLFLPLQIFEVPLGVLAIKFLDDADKRFEQMHSLLQAITSQSATALERVYLSHQAEQAQVLRARENLERALLNSVSHDLRTPLVTITGVLSTMRDEHQHLNDKVRQELLNTALEEAQRLNTFVGNLLDMTRLEAGELRLKLDLCDVQDLVGCALNAIEQRVGSRQIVVKLPPEMLLVQMDLVLMTQVLVNLLDNALKHSPPDTPIAISGRADKKEVIIEVADRGPGVSEADLPRIFDKFFRISVPETTGTGLGLSICKGIVEAHGGKIVAENRDAGGLRIIVRLPQEREQDVERG